MGNLRACFAVAMLALAACGSDHAQPDASIKLIDAAIDAKVWQDAPPKTFDFSCMGNAEPTNATADITVAGTVQRAYLNGAQPDVQPRDGATVKACKAGAADCDNANQYGTTATTAGGGNFSIGPVSTNMMPLDSYIEMTDTGSRTTYVYPPAPLVADQGMVPVLTFDPDLVDLLGQAGCPQDDDANGLMLLMVVDCANAPIDDKTNLALSIKQGGTEVSGTQVVDLSLLGPKGTYLVCNVPEDAATTVGATYKAMALRAHDVKVVKATTTATIIRPGY